jgi:hypothetical protein
MALDRQMSGRHGEVSGPESLMEKRSKKTAANRRKAAIKKRANTASKMSATEASCETDRA